LDARANGGGTVLSGDVFLWVFILLCQQSIQKWGNHFANLYWEAHLKPGHVPPEQCVFGVHTGEIRLQLFIFYYSKMESFIRSKYESRRWALDGPPPTDPSTLDNNASAQAPPAPTSQPAPTHRSSQSLSTRTPVTTPVTTRQPQTHQLLSSTYINRPTGPVPAPAAPVAPAVQQPKAPENDLFTLDFHAPPAPTANSSEPKKDVKQDILSLFSAPHPAAAVPTAAFNQFNQVAHWGSGVPQQQSVQQLQPSAMTGMMGSNGPGMWGVSSGWSGTPAMPPQPNVWGAPTAAAPSIPQQQINMFNTNAVWGAPTPPVAASATGADPFGSLSTHTQHAQQKDDAFGDIWGGFK